MLKIATRFLPRPVWVAFALWLPRYNRQLDPIELKKAIGAALPVGTSKDKVLEFLRSRHALYCDDLGTRVEACLLGEAPDHLILGVMEVLLTLVLKRRFFPYSLTNS